LLTIFVLSYPELGYNIQRKR